MINIELKVKVNNHRATINRLNSIGASKGEKLYQKDTYYNCTSNRIKVREINNNIYQLIVYKREDKSESKISNYKVDNISEEKASQIKRILKRTRGESIQVYKIRELWIYKHTRVHLDKVKNLGYFIELETIVNNKNNMDYFVEEHRELIGLLKLNEYKKIKNSYSDLLINKNCQKTNSTVSSLGRAYTMPV